jgi:hypothetical protein
MIAVALPCLLHEKLMSHLIFDCFRFWLLMNRASEEF